jgi:acyl-CoA oxidase
LTEQLAGVQSGLVVETTAVWDEKTREFALNTPHAGARKNWISQGATADKAVVVASLTVAGKKVRACVLTEAEVGLCPMTRHSL